MICEYFRSPEHNESPHRGRDRRERDVTPVYDSRTGSAHEPAASGKNMNMEQVRAPQDMYTLRGNNLNLVALFLQDHLVMIQMLQQLREVNYFGTEKESASRKRRRKKKSQQKWR